MRTVFCLLFFFFATKMWGIAQESCSSSSSFRHLRSPSPFYSYRTSVQGERHVKIAGLFPIHRSGCRNLLDAKNYNGLQRAFSLIYGLETVNESVQKGDKRISFDADIYDSCSGDISAMGTSLHFMTSNSDSSIQGVIGASYSSVCTQVSRILQAFNVTLLSYACTSTELSDKSKHPLFARTLPSDSIQSRVVYHIARELRWTSVIILVTEGSDYSFSLERAFRLANSNNQEIHVCSVVIIPKRTSSQEFITKYDEAMERVLHQIMTSHVDGILAFITADSKKLLFERFSSYYEENKIWHHKSHTHDSKLNVIATDSWDVTDDLSKLKITEFLFGSFVVQPEFTRSIHTEPLLHFLESTFQDISKGPFSEESNGNTWLQEFWNSYYESKCGNITGDERWDCLERRRADFRFDSKVNFVVDAIMTLSDAFERSELTENYKSLEFFQNKILTTVLKEDNGFEIRFNPCTGDRFGSYVVYRLEPNGKFQPVGWMNEQQTNVPIFKVSPRNSSRIQCRPKCRLLKGEFEEFEQINDCCYKCQNLSYRHYRKEHGKEIECPLGYWPNETSYESCSKILDGGLHLNNPWIVSAFFWTFFGILITLFIVFVLLRHSSHPVLKSYSRELAVFILFGVLICHLNTFVMILFPPNYIHCCLLRFTKTIGYSMFLSALFLKTYRIFRIFIGQFQNSQGQNWSSGKLKWTSPREIVMCCLFLIGIQVLINIVWIVLDHPEAVSIYPGSRHVRLCKVNAAHVMLAHFYNIMICIVTTAYSFLTRDVNANFNESRFINISMYSVCISWAIQFVIRAFMKGLDIDNAHKTTVIPEENLGVDAIVTSLNATLVLVFLYGDKIIKIYKRSKTNKEPVILRLSSQK